MLKHIPKSDINLRPFKVYKTFPIAEDLLSASFAYNHTGSTDQLTDSELHEQGLWHQLYTMYYRDGYNPFTSYGTIMPKIPTNPQRTLGDGALILSIPQKMFGEGIKPGSLSLYNTANDEQVYDDFYGNLRTTTNEIYLVSLDVENGIIKFKDGYNNPGQLEFTNANFNGDGTISIVGETNDFTNFSANIENDVIQFEGIIVAIPTILQEIVGNVIYEHGIIAITNDVISGSITGSRRDYFDNYDLEYKSTNTIYENEFLLIVGEDEFNVSTNPTSYTEMNVETGSIILNTATQYQIDARTISSEQGGVILYINDSGIEVPLAPEPGNIYNFYAKEILENNLIGCSLQNFKQNVVNWRNSDKYQRTTLNNPYISAVNGVSASGFDVYEYSSSVDPIGSYLAPYITTIGLYDENMDMVAVAKLATPVKSMPDLPVNFLVRFDS